MRREYKCKILKMHFKLRDQQLKTILYIYSLVYQNSGNHKQKIIIDTHTHQEKKRGGEFKHNTIDSYQIT